MASTTRSLYIIDSFLAGFKGVAPYVYNASRREITRVKDSLITGLAVQYYEVAILNGKGSWWAPTAAASMKNLAWPDPVVPVLAEGNGIWTQLYGESALRPQNLFWWIPDTVLSTLPITPAINQGQLSGSWPPIAP